MIPGFNLTELTNSVGPLAVVLILAAIIFAESGLLIGFFLPGDTVLFSAGFLVYGGILHFDIHLMVLILFIAAVLGDSVGYLFGRRIGRKIFKRPDSILFRQENMERAEAFYEKHGGKTIIIARFVPIVRTFAPIIAGVGKMSYKVFLTFNMIGAGLWAVGVTYAGYFAGGWLEKMGVKPESIDKVILPVILIVILASLLPALYHLFKDKKQRDAVWAATKRQVNVLLRRK
ncbi:MAG: VTT domain-containing protein [Candidatus Saccharimonadales bacterium]